MDLPNENHEGSQAAFCDKMTGFVSEERAVDAICPDCDKAFIVVFHNILVSMVGSYSLYGWTTRWIGNQLGDEAWRAADNGIKSIQRLVTSGELQGSLMCHVLIGDVEGAHPWSLQLTPHIGVPGGFP